MYEMLNLSGSLEHEFEARREPVDELEPRGRIRVEFWRNGKKFA